MKTKLKKYLDKGCVIQIENKQYIEKLYKKDDDYFIEYIGKGFNVGDNDYELFGKFTEFYSSLIEYNTEDDMKHAIFNLELNELLKP